jgi:ABC-type antimicrobial peptide transport system permease subunit
LFLGFSFLLIAAALVLVALLFGFAVERRAEEIGLLLALGFRPKQVRRLLLVEAAGLVALGCAGGLAGGALYARVMIHGLATLWRDAVGTTALEYHASWESLAGGAVASALVALATIAFALRHQARRTARELLAGVRESLPPGSAPRSLQSRRRPWSWIALGAALAAIALTGQAVVRDVTSSPGVFFGAGALGLLAGIAASAAYLDGLARRESARSLTVRSLGIRNACRRRSRSLAVIGMLAAGSFLIAAIGVFQLEPPGDARRDSGTGGFALIGEATFPIVQDLNTAPGLQFFALDPEPLEGASFVSLRVRDGDDASCLNLNRAQQPRLLGVDPGALATRGAFTFAKVAPGNQLASGWNLLKSGATSDSAPLVVPAIGDLNSILWAMGKKVGDTLRYADGRGREFQVRIVGAVANSVLQGNLLIDEAAFVRLFPSEAGYRMFLVDAPPDRSASVSAELTRGLQSAGVEFSSTGERLSAFNAVQNTYLGTFQLLGGLGLILGSVGLGVMVLRNVLERRAELALLLAVGYRPRQVRRLVLTEHGGLLFAGLGFGIAAASLAVLPSVLSPAAEIPFGVLGLTLGGTLMSGGAWTWIATVSALRGRLLNALRDE